MLSNKDFVFAKIPDKKFVFLVQRYSYRRLGCCENWCVCLNEEQAANYCNKYSSKTGYYFRYHPIVVCDDDLGLEIIQ